MLYGKDDVGFLRRGTSLEPETPVDPGSLTPIEQCFVCTAGEVPLLEGTPSVMRVEGTVDEPVELDLDALRSLPQHRVIAWIECAGNGRRLFPEVAQLAIEADYFKTPWGLNALALVEWEGPRVRDVLELVGLDADARWVGFAGHDDGGVENEPPLMCLPIDKALDPDTIIALSMNGEPLPMAHGGPARVVVPGWIGAYWIKWINNIIVSSEWLSSWRSDGYYVHRDVDGQAVGPLTTHPVKSHLSLAWPARCSPGDHTVTGIARSGAGGISRVEWRLDQGIWMPASLGDPLGAWAWTPFSIDVTLDSGAHVIETRATDAAGSMQPENQPAHPNGLMWHAITPHPVMVS